MQRFFLVGIGMMLAAAVLLHAPASLRAADGVHAEAEEHAAGEHADDHAAGGKPQIPMNFRTDLALWSLITFVLFLFILKAIAWGPLREALDRREAGIAKNISEAESARVRAEQMLAEHERKLAKVQDEVKEILAEARRDADTAKQNIMAEASREAEATRQRAVADIERAKNQALNELFDVMSSRVIEASEHVIGRSLNESDHSRLVQEALAQVSNKA